MTPVDVLVVGGGPAGCVAAWEAAAAGAGRVLLVERDRAIGAPVRCAEGVGSAGLREFLEPDGAAWVSRRITRVILIAPDDTEVRLAEGDVGYVLDRTRFEPELADRASRAGAAIRISTEAVALERADGASGGWRVRLRGPGAEETVTARVVIGADGVETMVGRWAGLDTRVAARDMESCAQYVVANIEFDPDAIYLHFGPSVAPGGYAWIFPKGPGVANVGLGVVTLRGDGRTVRRYLDDYVARHFPHGTVTGLTVGGVISGATVKRTATDGLLLAGDAAHMINPLSGGGIINAMKAGRLAGRHAARALAEDDVSARNLQPYHDEWMRLLGDAHLKYYKLKETINKFDDDFFNRLARTVNGIAPEKRTLGRVMASALVHHPTLIPIAAQLFVQEFC
ncbi:MAG TPA: NAD(P)/FAD-dependent oxidoreductase [Gemmatimonadales bacterium]|nr:NAD(P)/FAD-dependent oxidoreductase [Gemmatimonadales bacterium]